MRGLFFEGPIFGGAYVRREICVSKSIGLACSGKEIYHFTLFYFVFRGKFQVQALRGAYIRRGDLTEGFLRYDFGGLIFGGAYTWRGLFSEFYGIWINERLTFGILWKFNPIWLFFLLSGRCLLPKYYFSKFNCTSRPLFTICLVISIIPTSLTMQ